MSCCEPPWEQYLAGIEAVDALLAKIGHQPVAKAASVLTRAGYERATQALLHRITEATRTPDREALQRAAERLDHDWPRIPVAERNRVIQAASETFLKVPPIVVPRVSVAVGEASADMIGAAREAAARAHGLAIGASLSAADQRVADYARRAQASYITDAYGERAERFEQRARDIVADGLERGAGRAEIGDRLNAELVAPGLRRSSAYWYTVASVHMVRARSWGVLSGLQEAEIERYEISAAMDEVTCDTCRFLDGKSFDTGEAVARYERVEQADDPQDVENLQPWVGVVQDADGQPTLYAEAHGVTHDLATVVRSGEGEQDARGKYTDAVSSERLQELGIDSPPFHGGCRCLVVPV